jgi:hypothetical protein
MAGERVYIIRLPSGITYFVNARGFNNCAAQLYRSELGRKVEMNDHFEIIGPTGTVREYARTDQQAGFQALKEW